MLRLSLVSLVFVSCASLPSNEVIVGKTHELRPGGGLREEHGPAPVTEASEIDVPALASAGSESLPVDWLAEPAVLVDPPRLISNTSAEDEGLRESRFTIKAGLYEAEDADELDDGYIINVSWMRFLSPLLALELEVGYLDADGEDAGVEADVWGMPLMVNGRVNLPVWILDVYGGLGVGTIYYDAEAQAGAFSAEDDGFVLGGNGFLGATINIADAVALGLELKYYLTEEIDDVDAALDAYALMLTLGFSR